MNGTPGMFGQQQQQMLPPNLQQQVMLQQLQQQQLLQQQQPAAPLQAPAAAAVPNYGAAVAQMQARLAQQAALQQGPPGIAGQPLAVHMPPGAAVAVAMQAAPTAAAFAPQQAAAVAPSPAAAAAAGTPANAPMALPPVAPQQAAVQAAATAGTSAAQAAAAGAQAAAAGAAGEAADRRFEKVGFAKLLGDGLEYYIKKYEIVLGRKSKVGCSRAQAVLLQANLLLQQQMYGACRPAENNTALTLCYVHINCASRGDAAPLMVLLLPWVLHAGSCGCCARGLTGAQQAALPHCVQLSNKEVAAGCGGGCAAAWDCRHSEGPQGDGTAGTVAGG